MQTTKTIAVFGGSFNPPGKHHQTIVRELAKQFDEVVVVPCGPRPDKTTVNDIESVHRAAMADIAFGGLENVRVDLFDLEHDQFTRTIDLETKYSKQGEVWHVVGSDLIQGGANGASVIQREWKDGKRLWKQAKFVVNRRKGYVWDPRDLPPRSRVTGLNLLGSSTQAREMTAHNRSAKNIVSSNVLEYINRHGLYRGGFPSRLSEYSLSDPRIELVVDERNEVPVGMARRLRRYVHANPNVLVVLGGDGTMLHAIRKHWRRRLPFLGLHLGTVGFLMNHLGRESVRGLFGQRFSVRQSPLLHVEVMRPDGTVVDSNAFNDAWVERKSGQAAWVQVKVNGHIRIPRLIGDGVLVATAAGSTAYARAMGATPLHVDSPSILLMGSNVYEPHAWKSAHLPLETRIELKAVDPDKRPLSGFIDGIPEGDVASMKIRVSRIAAPELLFLPGNEISEKLTKIQFPF